MSAINLSHFVFNKKFSKRKFDSSIRKFEIGIAILLIHSTSRTVLFGDDPDSGRGWNSRCIHVAATDRRRIRVPTLGYSPARLDPGRSQNDYNNYFIRRGSGPLCLPILKVITRCLQCPSGTALRGHASSPATVHRNHAAPWISTLCIRVCVSPVHACSSLLSHDPLSPTGPLLHFCTSNKRSNISPIEKLFFHWTSNLKDLVRILKFRV